MNALNPVRRVGEQIAEPIEIRLGESRERARRRAGGAARARRHPAQAGERLPPRAVGRHAPAGDDRDGPRLRPGDRHRRRADDRARRHGPGPDPGAARAPPPGARPVAHPHHPRPVGHRRDVRPDAGDVRRPRRRGGAGAPDLHARRVTRTPRSCSARSRTSTPTGGPRDHPRLAARPARSAHRLPVPSALPGRHGRLPRGRPAGGRASPMASASPATSTRPGARPAASVSPAEQWPRPACHGGRAAPAAPAPAGGAATPPAERCRRMTDLLRLEGLEVHFPIRGGVLDAAAAPDARRRPGRRRHRPEPGPGEVLALVGESGSGKTTTGRVIVKLTRQTGGTDRLRRRRRLRPVGHQGAARLPAPGPDHLPGPVRDAEPEADHPRLRGRAARGQPARATPGRPRGTRHRGARGGRPRRADFAFRYPARAVGRPAPARRHRRARSSWTRSSSWPTSRSRCSTSPSGPSCCG